MAVRYFRSHRDEEIDSVDRKYLAWQSAADRYVLHAVSWMSSGITGLNGWIWMVRQPSGIRPYALPGQTII